jgi:uncharacterized membrane protein YgcG
MPYRRSSRPATIRRLLCDVVTLARRAVTSRTQLVAENPFLRKQLALYQERRVKPRRTEPSTRVILVLLSRLLDCARCSPWFSQTLSSGGIVGAGGSSGGGNRGPDGRPFQGMCSD